MTVEKFSVLVVCTANICRSPVAEALLRRGLGSRADVEVSSAGLSARVGEPVWDEMAAAAGLPVDGHWARQVTADGVRAGGLVLTMTREQRSALVERFPAAVRRTFTLREFGALAAIALQRELLTGVSEGDRLRDLTVLAPRLRSYRSGEPDDDVADPYGRPRRDVVIAVARVSEAVDQIVHAARRLVPAAPARG